MSQPIHPYDLKPITVRELAALWGMNTDTLNKQINSGNYPGAFFKCGSEWRTNNDLLRNVLREKAAKDSGE